MKNILVKIILALSIISSFNISILPNTYAAENCENSNWVQVTVTEKVPWACCVPTWKADSNWNTSYTCHIEKGFWSVISMFWKIIKYFTYLAALWWVLYLIINGIMYSMWWADQSLKDEAKKRITWTLIWLVLLLLSWIILNMVAPWIYK